MHRLHTRAWLLAALSGALQVLIFPTPDLYWLCWIAFVPLLLAVLQGRGPEMVHLPETLAQPALPASAGQAFLLGWLSGLIWCAGTCYWIYHVMHLYGGLSAPVSVGVLVLFCLFVGAFFGLFTLALAVVANIGNGVRMNTRRALVLAPFAWVAVEFVRTHILGFPWDLLGTVQVDNVPLTRLATVTGVYGISFEIIVVNTAFAAAFLMRRSARKLLLASAVVAALALQITIIVNPPRLAASETARLVQQNIPISSENWTPEYFMTTMNGLRAESVPPAPGQGRGEPRPDLIVWPESPAPFYVNDPLFRGMVTQMAREANAYVIVGTLGVENRPSGQRPQELFNSAALIAPDGQWTARYDKIHLVPFGEYVPYKTVLTFARQLTAEVGDFVPGSKRTVFAAGRYRIGTFICYESIFPGEVREFAANGAQVFVNISNDGWFGHTAAPFQHLNQARMRAIENHRWLLRATNTGITAAIDPYGRVVDAAARDVRTEIDVPFSVVTGTTFYTRHGDWFAWLCAIIFVAALVFAIVQRAREHLGQRRRETERF